MIISYLNYLLTFIVFMSFTIYFKSITNYVNDIYNDGSLWKCCDNADKDSYYNDGQQPYAYYYKEGIKELFRFVTLFFVSIPIVLIYLNYQISALVSLILALFVFISMVGYAGYFTYKFKRGIFVERQFIPTFAHLIPITYTIIVLSSAYLEYHKVF